MSARAASPPHPSRRTTRRKPHVPIPARPTLVPAPVPPSLAHSPYLHSPRSMFRRAVSQPRLPSQEDENWLRDTVPIGVDASPPRQSSPPVQRRISDDDRRETGTDESEAPRGRSFDVSRSAPGVLSTSVPTSAPISVVPRPQPLVPVSLPSPGTVRPLPKGSLTPRSESDVDLFYAVEPSSYFELRVRGLS